VSVTVRSPCNLTLRGFSWERVSAASASYEPGPALSVNPRICLRIHLHAHRTSNTRLPNLLRPSIAFTQRFWTITRFPSARLSPHLRADSPCADERCAETLGFREHAFHMLYRTHVTFALPIPPVASQPTSQAYGTLYRIRNQRSGSGSDQTFYSIYFGF